MIFPQAQHFVSKEHFHNFFDANLPPVIRVQPGDFVHVETNDCFHGKISPTGTTSVQDIPKDERNPVTGPIFVEGAEPGDILAVTLLDIRPQGVGIACCGPRVGQLSHWVDRSTTTFFDLSQNGKLVTMREDTDETNDGGSHKPTQCRLGPISFPARPMLGVIGVAPPPGQVVSTMPAGPHGGNLDNQANGIGSTIYLPVFCSGALLSMADMHASQGDGEISGNGVEIGGNVLLTCRVLKSADVYPDGDQWRLEFPVTETPTHWITHGVVRENIAQTTVVACDEAAKILVGQWGLTPSQAFTFLSVHGDLGLCQSCHPDVGTQIAKMTVPKLDWCPRPFRMLHEQDEKQQDEEPHS